MCEMKNRIVKPRWGILYALTALLLGFIGLIEIAIAAGAARQVPELVLTLAGFAAMAIWVRLNRVALDMAGAVSNFPYRIPASTAPGAVSEAPPLAETQRAPASPHKASQGDDPLDKSHLAFGMHDRPLRMPHEAPAWEVSDERCDLHRACARVLRSVLGVRKAL